MYIYIHIYSVGFESGSCLEDFFLKKKRSGHAFKTGPRVSFLAKPATWDFAELEFLEVLVLSFHWMFSLGLLLWIVWSCHS